MTDVVHGLKHFSDYFSECSGQFVKKTTRGHA